MTKFRNVLLLFTFTLAACQSEADPHAKSGKDAMQARMPVSPFRNPVAMSDSSQKSKTPSPDPGEVLRAIYKKEGDGSSSYDIGNKAWASYWYGHEYELDGRRFFTGFAYSAEENPDDEMGMPAPGDQVTISQATYALAPEGSVTFWEFVSADNDIGRFGGYEKGNAVDEDLPPQTYRMASGDYLLAVPAWTLEAGTRLKTAELFALQMKQHRWQYVGSAATGEDNSAGCASDAAEEGLPPCVASAGVLQFQPQAGIEMPLIRVAVKGMVIDSPGKIRASDARDTAEYRYDPGKSKYQLVQR